MRTFVILIAVVGALVLPTVSRRADQGVRELRLVGRRIWPEVDVR